CLRAAVFLFIEDGVGVPDGRTLVPVEAVAGDIDLSADAPGCKLDPSRSIPEPVVGRLETDVFKDCLPEPVRISRCLLFQLRVAADAVTLHIGDEITLRDNVSVRTPDDIGGHAASFGIFFM